MLNLLAYLYCSASVILVSLCLAKGLRARGPIFWLLGIALIGCGQIVLVMELLSLLHFIGLPGLLLVHTAGFLIVVVPGLRPHLIEHWQSLVQLFEGMRTLRDPLLAVLAIAVGLFGIVNLFLAVYVPPNNYDGMTYHMARVGYYLQQASFDSFPTPNIRQTSFPANAEILILWQVVILKSDRLAGIVQWLCWCWTLMAVYALARNFGPRNRKRPALFAALAFAVFPQILLQSSSTQNDLVLAFFICCAFLFALDYLKPDSPPGGMVFSATALGLAIGTKAVAMLFLPGFALAFIAAAWICKPIPWKRLIHASLLCIMAALLFGSYFYIQNLRIYGVPGGSGGMTALTSVDRLDLRAFASNFGRLYIQILSPGGSVPNVQQAGTVFLDCYRALSEFLFRSLAIAKELPGIDFPGVAWVQFEPLWIHEDYSWFGPIFGFFGLPVLLYVVLRKARNGWVSLASRIMAFSAISYLIMAAALLRWNPWFGRLMTPMAALAAPALSLLYSEGAAMWGRAFNGILALVCLVSATSASLFNEMKPMIAGRTIWGRSRIELLTWANSHIRPVADMMDRLGFRGLKVGLVPADENTFDYVFWGRNFERKLVPMLFNRKELINPDGFSRVDCLLFLGDSQRYFLTPRAEFALDKVYGKSDLKPLLARLRSPGSGWRAILDMDDSWHLFVQPGVNIGSDDFRGLRDYFPGQLMWPDGWVGPKFTAHVKIDPASPILSLKGEMPYYDEKSRTLSVLYGKEVLTTLNLPRAGPFSLRLPLYSFGSERVHSYQRLLFATDHYFNPKRTGQSADNRNLSWRSFELKLGSISESLKYDSTRPDIIPEFTWYSDKWVQQRFFAPVRRDPSRPFLRVRGTMQYIVSQPELRILYNGELLARLQPGERGVVAATIPLATIIGTLDAEYYPIEFAANCAFNPKKKGQSGDDRDLSWQLYEIKLVDKADAP